MALGFTLDAKLVKLLVGCRPIGLTEGGMRAQKLQPHKVDLASKLNQNAREKKRICEQKRRL